MAVDNPCTTEAKSKNHKPLQIAVARRQELTRRVPRGLIHFVDVTVCKDAEPS